MVLFHIVLLTGLALEFATHIFEQWLKEKDINSIATTLKRAGLEGKLLVSVFFEAYSCPCQTFLRVRAHNGLFTLSDLDSDSGSKPSGYIAQCRSFHIAQSPIQIPILTVNFRNGIGIRVRTRVHLPQCEWAFKWCLFFFCLPVCVNCWRLCSCTRKRKTWRRCEWTIRSQCFVVFSHLNSFIVRFALY